MHAPDNGVDSPRALTATEQPVSSSFTVRMQQKVRRIPLHLWFWATYGVLLLLFAVGACSALPSLGKSALEAVTFLVLLLALVANPQVTPVMLQLAPRQRSLVGAAVVLMVAAHVAKVPKVTFPLVDWRMFGRSASGPVQVLNYTAVRDNQARERIVPGASISDATVSRLDTLVRRLLDAKDPGAKHQLRQVIRGIARLESLETVDRGRIVAVEISACVLPVSSPREPRCTRLQQVDVEPEAGGAQ